MSIRGFVLVEVLVVLAITAVLAVITLPSYSDHMRAARRSDGKSALIRIQLDQEQWRAAHTSYTAHLTGDCDRGLCWPSNSSPDGHYQLSIESAGVLRYRALARGLGDQANDREGSIGCAVLILSVSPDAPLGARTPAECW